MIYSFFKRVSDFVASMVLFLLLSPIFLLTSILLIIQLKGSPFFFQKRPGKDERIFKIIKFKSMTNAKDKDGNLLSHTERITPLGRFIRKTSIDEIPQLINVIIGDMSFVGPRPLKVDYLSLYSDFQKKRHIVRPGITGWAQVNGRNNITHTQKFEFDVWYVMHRDFFLDIKILLLTIKKVFIKEGIGENGINLNTPFNGNN